MTYFYHAGGGGLPENHPAYEMRHNLDDEAFKAALYGELLHVIAPRQVGKTSLLKQLSCRLRAEGWRCVIVDLSTLLSLPMVTWYTELGNKLAEEFTPTSPPTLTNHLQMSAYLTKEALHWSQGQPRIAVFFDEVESAVKVHDEQGQPFSDAFFMTIRDLYQKRDTHKGLLTIGLAGAVSASRLVKDDSISPFNVGQELDLDDFTQDETRAFTGHLMKLNIEVDDAVHEIIYAWTNGHPYLTHCICSELEKRVYAQHLAVITPDDVTHIVKHVFLQPRNPQLEDRNIRHVRKMLKDLPDTARPLWEQLQQGSTLFRKSVDTETLTDLYITGVVKNQDEHIVIRNRIYEEVFMIKAAPESATDVNVLQHKIEKDAYDVFICYNRADRPEAMKLGKQLKEHDILPWLDSWKPGGSIEEQQRQQIAKINSAAVLVGKSGIATLQQMLADAFLHQFIQRGIPLIPVFLKDAPQEPLPIFLNSFGWVDFREEEPDPMGQLIWGITGKRPGSPQVSSKPLVTPLSSSEGNKPVAEVDANKLREAMLTAYNSDDLIILRANLNVRYDDLAEGPLAVKILRLIEHCRNRGMYDTLVHQVLTERPHLKNQL